MRLRLLMLLSAAAMLVPAASAEAAGFVVHLRASGHHADYRIRVVR